MARAWAQLSAAVSSVALLAAPVAGQTNRTAPSAPVPVVSAPVVPSPAAPVPMVPAPVTPAPVVSALAVPEPVTTAPAASATTQSVKYAPQIVAPGTPIRLMFLKEINSRTAVPGQLFKMRVHEPVFMNGQAVIPVGATAWGEVVSFDSSGAVGKGGKLGVRVLYLDLPEGRLPLKGEANQRGSGNGAGLALAIVGFGLLGLFSAGDSARFKGGDQLTVFADLALAESSKILLTTEGASAPSVHTLP